jgi:hypothetical protein
LKVLIYVEGASDEAAMGELLHPLLQRKQAEGIEIRFLEAQGGDHKKDILLQVPFRAARILSNNPDAVVVALPDLYPRNKGFPHETFAQLREGVMQRFKNALKSIGLGEDTRYLDRFKVFCFKHDLEALVLAAYEALALRLETESLDVTWKLPVEDQNHNFPPKRVVEEIFQHYGQTYEEVVDAPLILGLADYRNVADACPQCFKPFVEFLENLTSKV